MNAGRNGFPRGSTGEGLRRFQPSLTHRSPATFHPHTVRFAQSICQLSFGNKQIDERETSKHTPRVEMIGMGRRETPSFRRWLPAGKQVPGIPAEGPALSDPVLLVLIKFVAVIHSLPKGGDVFSSPNLDKLDKFQVLYDRVPGRNAAGLIVSSGEKKTI